MEIGRKPDLKPSVTNDESPPSHFCSVDSFDVLLQQVTTESNGVHGVTSMAFRPECDRILSKNFSGVSGKISNGDWKKRGHFMEPFSNQGPGLALKTFAVDRGKCGAIRCRNAKRLRHGAWVRPKVAPQLATAE